jgi:hypothetical protein
MRGEELAWVRLQGFPILNRVGVKMNENELEENVAGEELVEEVDIEATAAEIKRRPRARRYRFRVDRERYVTADPKLKGRKILEIAGKTSPENWLLSQKLHGGKVVTVELDDKVDLREPGVERFMTLPKDQTEG